MNLVDIFDRSLRGLAEKTAIEWQDRELTFGEVESRSNRIAWFLAERGVGSGDRVAIYLANRIEVIDIYLACLKLGAIFLPINILYAKTEIGHIVADARPALFITNVEVEVACPVVDLELVRTAIESGRDDRPSVVTGMNNPAAIIYTSGTTGRSKGVVLSHGNFAANAGHIIEEWRISIDDHFLCALPLFHVHALGNGLHAWLSTGFHMKLLERFERSKIAEELLAYRPTLFFGVPTMYVRMLEIEPESAAAIGRDCRLFVSGSAPLPEAVFEQFESRFGHRILERYGMTETLMNLGNPYEGRREPGTVGRPMPGVEIRIVDKDNEDVAEGEIGELLVRGANVFERYWCNDSATEEVFTDGWFRTGDLSSRRADGYFVLHGRMKEVIMNGGFKILPREVEEWILGQPGVLEVAVVGLPDEARGEIPAAFLVVDDSCQLDTMERNCSAALASYKVPRRWIRVGELPRNALGKVLKHEIIRGWEGRA